LERGKGWGIEEGGIIDGEARARVKEVTIKKVTIKLPVVITKTPIVITKTPIAAQSYSKKYTSRSNPHQISVQQNQADLGGDAGRVPPSGQYHAEGCPTATS